MPPAQTQSQSRPSVDIDHMLPPAHKQSSVGPIVGAIIIIVLLVFGGLYFWGAHLNKERNNTENQVPFILPENSVQ